MPKWFGAEQEKWLVYFWEAVKLCSSSFHKDKYMAIEFSYHQKQLLFKMIMLLHCESKQRKKKGKWERTLKFETVALPLKCHTSTDKQDTKAKGALTTAVPTGDISSLEVWNQWLYTNKLLPPLCLAEDSNRLIWNC